MKFRYVYSVVIVMALCGGAHSADIVNNDETAYTLEITENGERLDVVVDAGQTVSVCQSGCFLTAPNGDRIALQGGESISLVGGVATIQ